jgi:four helix bundle protein
VRSETQEVRSESNGRKPIQSYRDIEAYRRSMAILAPVHKLIRKLPKDERFELASQMRRAAKSVPANIGEGYALKRSAANFRSRLDIALGSANEMIIHLEICVAIGYLTEEEVNPLIDEYEAIGKMIYRLAENWKTYGTSVRK